MAKITTASTASPNIPETTLAPIRIQMRMLLNWGEKDREGTRHCFSFLKDVRAGRRERLGGLGSGEPLRGDAQSFEDLLFAQAMPRLG